MWMRLNSPSDLITHTHTTYFRHHIAFFHFCGVSTVNTVSVFLLLFRMPLFLLSMLDISIDSDEKFSLKKFLNQRERYWSTKLCLTRRLDSTLMWFGHEFHSIEPTTQWISFARFCLLFTLCCSFIFLCACACFCFCFPFLFCFASV